jgi:hypothetical protein
MTPSMQQPSGTRLSTRVRTPFIRRLRVTRDNKILNPTTRNPLRPEVRVAQNPDLVEANQGAVPTLHNDLMNRARGGLMVLQVLLQESQRRRERRDPLLGNLSLAVEKEKEKEKDATVAKATTVVVLAEEKDSSQGIHHRHRDSSLEDRGI